MELITGGDSGIGRAVAIGFAKEGAEVAVVYLDKHEKELVEDTGRRCILIPGDVGESEFCFQAVERTMKELNRLDTLVKNVAEQHVVNSIEELTDEQIIRTFKTNIFAHFDMTRSAVKHMKKGSAMRCATSITAYEGNKTLIDYASTKGAITTFVRTMSRALAKWMIRVNGVDHGPTWTPLIPSSYPAEHVAEFLGILRWGVREARRGRAVLCVPRKRRGIVHNRSGDSRERQPVRDDVSAGNGGENF